MEFREGDFDEEDDFLFGIKENEKWSWADTRD